MIAIGSDHAAFPLKEEIKAYLIEKGYKVQDFGTFGPERVDYCDFGFKVGEAVASGDCEKGLLLCSEPYSAKLSREHNDTNILALGARVVGIGLAKMIVDVWLSTEFEGGRHAGRIENIARYERHSEQ